MFQIRHHYSDGTSALQPLQYEDRKDCQRQAERFVALTGERYTVEWQLCVASPAPLPAPQPPFGMPAVPFAALERYMQALGREISAKMLT
jgi:hypothetical protein